MYWRDIATLVGVKKTVNENGYKVEIEARREVFVNKKSATRSEFYAAKQAGDKIALVLEVRGSDYEGETRIEYGGNPYEVVRTYTRAGEVRPLEIVVSDMTCIRCNGRIYEWVLFIDTFNNEILHILFLHIEEILKPTITVWINYANA